MITNQDRSLIERAIGYSKTHNHSFKNNFSLCAILKPSKTCSHYYAGFNQKKTHPLQKKFQRNKYQVWLHAEIDAIQQALRVEDSISESILYVARTDAQNEVRNASPCEGCLEAIYHFGIHRVMFTTYSNDMSYIIGTIML